MLQHCRRGGATGSTNPDEGKKRWEGFRIAFGKRIGTREPIKVPQGNRDEPPGISIPRRKLKGEGSRGGTGSRALIGDAPLKISDWNLG